jgi:hypothetical protein
MIVCITGRPFSCCSLKSGVLMFRFGYKNNETVEINAKTSRLTCNFHSSHSLTCFQQKSWQRQSILGTGYPRGVSDINLCLLALTNIVCLTHRVIHLKDTLRSRFSAPPYTRTDIIHTTLYQILSYSTTITDTICKVARLQKSRPIHNPR